VIVGSERRRKETKKIINIHMFYKEQERYVALEI
jgi:hypothetical protein